jgi:hypothetical protein
LAAAKSSPFAFFAFLRFSSDHGNERLARSTFSQFQSEREGALLGLDLIVFRKFLPVTNRR